jgi:steroid delta-isomerase-like uncharacterized protein
MASQDINGFIRSLYDIYNRRDFASGEKNVTDDFEWEVVPTGETLRGRAGYRQFVETWAGAFSDSTVEVTNITADGDTAAVEFIGRGTHTGAFPTPFGVIPPSGRTVAIPFNEVHTLRDGKVRRSKSYFDSSTILAQLGAVPNGEAERNKELVRRFYETVFVGQDYDAARELMAADYVHHDPQLPPEIQKGRETYLAGARAIIDGFSDVSMTLDNFVAEGDRVAFQWVFAAAHTGEAFGIPATGRRVSFEANVIYRIENGKLAEAWNVFDALGMMQQLGVIPG